MKNGKNRFGMAALGLGIVISLAGCGGEGQSGNADNAGKAENIEKTESVGKTESAGKTESTGKTENNTDSTEKTKEAAEQGNTKDTTGDISAVISNRTELTWYVADDCVAFCYSGEGAQILSAAYKAGRKPHAAFSFYGGDYVYRVEWCQYCGQNIQYEYQDNGAGKLGVGCGGFQAKQHCNLALEITGELGNGELWICVRHNGPWIDPESLPGMTVRIVPDQENNSKEDDFYDQISTEKISYHASMPERFLGNVGEVSNIVGIGDFPCMQVSYAKTDDYELMRNDTSSWLICFDEKGKVVQYVDFWKNLDTGELVAEERDASIFSDTSKYQEFTTYVKGRHVQMYPNYFSKPWLTLEQFQTMNRD